MLPCAAFHHLAHACPTKRLAGPDAAPTASITVRVPRLSSRLSRPATSSSWLAANAIYLSAIPTRVPFVPLHSIELAGMYEAPMIFLSPRVEPSSTNSLHTKGSAHPGTLK